MSDSKHTTPDGIPILDSLAEEVFGSLSIDPRWFELPEDETLSSEGDAVVVNLLMYGEGQASEGASGHLIGYGLGGMRPPLGFIPRSATLLL